MNPTQIASLPHGSPIPSIGIKVTQVQVPKVPTEAEAKANIQKQVVTFQDLETGISFPASYILRPELHMNETQVGADLLIEAGAAGSIKVKRWVPAAQKAEADALRLKGLQFSHLEKWWIDIDYGVKITPIAAAVAEPVTEAPTDPAPAKPEPAATPEPVADEPAAEECLEPDGLYLHDRLIHFARGQALCRLAATKVFREAGLDVGPDQLGGVATSLFIQLAQKGDLDAVIKAAYEPRQPVKPQSAPTRQQAPAAAPTPARQPIPKAPTVVTPAHPAPVPAVSPPKPAAAAPVTQSSSPSAPGVAASTPEAPKTAAPKPEQTPEVVLATYEKYVREGKFGPPQLAAMAPLITKLNMSWESPLTILRDYAAGLYGQAATEATLAKFLKMMEKATPEQQWQGLAGSPAMFLQRVAEAAK